MPECVRYAGWIFDIEIFLESAISSAQRVATSTSAALLIWLMTSLAASPLWATEINLHTNTTLSSEGYFVLTWDVAASAANHFTPTDELALLQADNSEMQNAVLRQKLPLHGAITLSGLDNGTFYFRVDAPSLSNNISSNVVHVEVKHHSLNKAFAFFTVGLLLFCILGASILIGHKNSGTHTA